jgi:hypothetical protein
MVPLPQVAIRRIGYDPGASGGEAGHEALDILEEVILDLEVRDPLQDGVG